MLTKDIMTQPVLAVRPDDSIQLAIKLMLDSHLSGLPVIDATGVLVGIITEGDFLRRAETGTQRHLPQWLEFLLGPGRLAEDYVRTHGRKVNEVMTTDVTTVEEDAPLEKVASIMEKRHIKRLPVLRSGKVVGIVSRANLLHALVSIEEAPEATAASDDAIRDAFYAALAKEIWAPIAGIKIIVHDGVLNLWGTILDERNRPALIVLAENLRGVRSVRDHLCWVDVSSGITIPSPEEEAELARKAS